MVGERKMINKKKILIGCIFAALFMVSNPVISALLVTSTSSTTTNLNVAAKQAIADAKTKANILLQQYGSDAGISTLCQRTNTVLSSTGLSDFCKKLDDLVWQLRNTVDSMWDDLMDLNDQMNAARKAGNYALYLQLENEWNKLNARMVILNALRSILQYNIQPILCGSSSIVSAPVSTTISSVSTSTTSASGCSCGQ